jgi:hypothetical protein
MRLTFVGAAMIIVVAVVAVVLLRKLSNEVGGSPLVEKRT